MPAAKKIEVAVVIALNAAKAVPGIDDNRMGLFTLENGDVLLNERSGKIDEETGRRVYSWKTESEEEGSVALAKLLNDADVSVRTAPEGSVSAQMVTCTDEEGNRIFLNEEEGAEDVWSVGSRLKQQ